MPNRVFAESYEPDLRAHATTLANALRVTQQYIGDDLLPPIKGWAWYDALTAHDQLLT